ncbi:NAD-dependent epimerase/dehydratase family protein [Actinomycetaceae bacterium L2_0104]
MMEKEVLVIGGNGLLGLHSVQVLLNRGYKVSSLALPPKPGQASLPDEVDAHWAGLEDMSDDQVRDLLRGRYAVFFAIGQDERTVPPAPASEFFYKANVLPTQRVARLARECGVEKFVLFGSYTAEFADRWPDLDYRGRNGYPRTRLLQEEVAIMEGGPEMDVTVLRLPYLFGLVEGQRPLWQFVIDQVRTQENPAVLPGSTSSATARQVGQAAVGAMENGAHGTKYPLNTYNLSYLELYRLACQAIGKDPDSVVVVLLESVMPTYEELQRQTDEAGVEHGIHLPDTARFQARDAVSDFEAGAELGLEDDDVVAAIRETFAWCVNNPAN